MGKDDYGRLSLLSLVHWTGHTRKLLSLPLIGNFRSTSVLFALLRDRPHHVLPSASSRSESGPLQPRRWLMLRLRLGVLLAVGRPALVRTRTENPAE